MSNALSPKYDVAIVGAGPAGSSAAIRLAQTGLRVLLVEQRKFPRAKLCGEFISPECLSHFAELGVADQMSLAGGARVSRTVFYSQNGRSLTVPSRWFGAGTHALGLSRARMDELFLERARAVGADILEEAQAVGVLLENGVVRGLHLRTSDRKIVEIGSAVTIDATGRARVLSRQIDKANAATKNKRASFVAFKAHLEDADIPDGDCEIYAYRGGYGGCSRVEGDRYNLCFIVPSEIAKAYGGDAKSITERVVKANVRAAASLGRVGFVDDWLAVPIDRYGRADLAPAPGLLPIGDAAAFIDPFTGSGILLALESARIAAEVVAAHLSDANADRSLPALAAAYRKRYAVAMNRRLRISALLRRAAFVPMLGEIAVRGLTLNERLTCRLAGATRAPAGWSSR